MDQIENTSMFVAGFSYPGQPPMRCLRANADFAVAKAILLSEILDIHVELMMQNRSNGTATTASINALNESYATARDTILGWVKPNEVKSQGFCFWICDFHESEVQLDRA